MPSPKYFASAFLVLCLSIVLLTNGRTSRTDNQQQEAMDFSRFPIVDLNAEEPADPHLKLKREAKGRKYGSKNLPRIKETTSQLFSNTDWDVGLPALPTEKSATVLIGKITSAEAHLSPDKTGVYSEFSMLVDSVLKNTSDSRLDSGQTIIIERSGGRIRMPSGKIIPSWTNHQNMPSVGGRYLLFLTRDFERAGDTGDGFYILTGYELQGGRVYPLDNTLPGHPISEYRGTSESSLLNDLLAALTKPSNP